MKKTSSQNIMKPATRTDARSNLAAAKAAHQALIDERVAAARRGEDALAEHDAAIAAAERAVFVAQVVLDDLNAKPDGPDPHNPNTFRSGNKVFATIPAFQEQVPEADDATSFQPPRIVSLQVQS